jgi:hypothetical protein
MQDAPRHPLSLAGFETMEAAASAIGDLRYDALSSLLAAVSAKLAADAGADRGRGRPALATELDGMASAASAAAEAAGRAWVICAPHMA